MKGHSKADLKRLDAALIALPNDNDPMLLPEFDGFCAGLLVCPDMIPPSAWLREVWGPKGPPAFGSIEEMQATLDLVMGHYNRVAEMLVPPVQYGPVMDEDRRTGRVLFAGWVEGFVRAVRLRPMSWKRITESGDQDAIAAFSLLLEIPLVGSGAGSLDPKRQAQLLKDAPGLIPDLVLELNRFTKSQRLEARAASPFPANWPVAPVQGGKVGRNDPCPCGSGKKYKKCCGATSGI